MKSLACGAAIFAGACTWAGVVSAAPNPSVPRLETQAWIVVPGDASCRTELELTSRSGAVSPVAMISDGGQVSLRFAMEEVAERAFLPIRIDQKAYANLVQRGDVEKVAVMTLSDETLGAMRKGGTLQIAWLSEEAVRASLAGAAQGITDLRTCGAQVSSEHRARRAAQDEARARAAQEASAKALADEQLATARAKTAAAEAERQRLRAQADQAQAEADRQRALIYADQQRSAELQRAELQRRRAGYVYYEDEDGPRVQWGPPRPYYTYRPYDPRYDR